MVNQSIKWIDELCSFSNEMNLYVVTQDYTIYYAIRERRLPLDQVRFIFMKDRKPIEVKMNEKGRIVGDVPDGFFDTIETLMDKLL